jgi:hypothetical protein
MNLKVVGAGFGRTGTQSLKIALEQLGVGPCYHMLEVFGNIEHIPLWAAATRGETPDWETLFGNYRSTVDWPGCAFWRDLAKKNPEAKILLSYRDSDAWYDSFHQTIYQAMLRESPPEPTWIAEHFKMTRELVLEQALGGRPDDRAHAIRCYEEHNEAVRNEFPADRLILHEVGDGWKPLCDGLGLPIPDEPYPRTNSTKEFSDRMKLMGS